MIRIATKTPPPAPRSRRRKAPRAGSKYPWAKMHVGDSFKVATYRAAESAASSARHFATTPSHRRFRVTRRAVTGGYRIWRTA